MAKPGLEELLFNKDILKPYTANQASAVQFFTCLNDEIFESKIPLPRKFIIKTLPGIWGEFISDWDGAGNKTCIVRLNKSYLTKFLFVNTLAHEMVHCWQWHFGKMDVAHNAEFYSWKPTFSKHGLKLCRALNSVGL